MKSSGGTRRTHTHAHARTAARGSEGWGCHSTTALRARGGWRRRMGSRAGHLGVAALPPHVALGAGTGAAAKHQQAARAASEMSGAGNSSVAADRTSSTFENEKSADIGDEGSAVRLLASGGHGGASQGGIAQGSRARGLLLTAYRIGYWVGYLIGSALTFARDAGASACAPAAGAAAGLADVLVVGLRARIAADPSFVFKLAVEVAQDQATILAASLSAYTFGTATAWLAHVTSLQNDIVLVWFLAPTTARDPARHRGEGEGSRTLPLAGRGRSVDPEKGTLPLLGTTESSPRTANGIPAEDHLRGRAWQGEPLSHMFERAPGAPLSARLECFVSKMRLYGTIGALTALLAKLFVIFVMQSGTPLRGMTPVATAWYFTRVTAMGAVR